MKARLVADAEGVNDFTKSLARSLKEYKRATISTAVEPDTAHQIRTATAYTVVDMEKVLRAEHKRVHILRKEQRTKILAGRLEPDA